MTVKGQHTSRRGIVISATAAVAAVLVAVGATAALNDKGETKKDTTVQQRSNSSTGTKTDSKTDTKTDGDKPADAPKSDPTFLAAADMPASPEAGAWQAGQLSSGLPDPEYTCIKGMLPAGKTSYMSYTGDMTAEAREFVVQLADASEAELIAKEVAQSIERCADVMKENTTWKKYGSYPDVANGVSVYGVYFAPENSEYHLQLFGVGRDGSTVVVTTLGQMGKETEAPVDAFTVTAKKAVETVF